MPKLAHDDEDDDAAADDAEDPDIRKRPRLWDKHTQNENELSDSEDEGEGGRKHRQSHRSANGTGTGTGTATPAEAPAPEAAPEAASVGAAPMEVDGEQTGAAGLTVAEQGLVEGARTAGEANTAADDVAMDGLSGVDAGDTVAGGA